MKTPPLLIAVFTLLAIADALGAEQRVSCPAQLTPADIQIHYSSEDWALFVLRPVLLTEGGMLHGPPSESAYLVPDQGSRRKSGKQTVQTQHWSFDVPHGYTKWMYCGYSSGATLKIFKEVTAAAVECTMTSSTVDQTVQEDIQFVCR